MLWNLRLLLPMVDAGEVGHYLLPSLMAINHFKMFVVSPVVFAFFLRYCYLAIVLFIFIFIFFFTSNISNVLLIFCIFLLILHPPPPPWDIYKTCLNIARFDRLLLTHYTHPTPALSIVQSIDSFICTFYGIHLF